MTLAGTPAIDGVQTYDLRLTPLRDPKADRIRELWVGTQDYLPRRARVDGNFTIAPLVDAPWTIDFDVKDGAAYIARERADRTLFMSHHRVVRDASIAFDDIAAPDPAVMEKGSLLQPAVTDTTLVEPPL